VSASRLAREARVEVRSSSFDLRERWAGYGLRHGTRLFSCVVFVALLALYASRQSGVLTPGGLSIEAAATLTLALAATGQTIVVLMGGIDLSIGGVISLTTVILATQSTADAGLAVWLPAVLVLGVAAGALNGVFISVLRLEPFVVTLATWSIWSGAALWILSTDGGSIADSLVNFAGSTFLGLGIPIWLTVALVVFWLWFSRISTGIAIKAIGSNRTSAYLSGVRLERTTIIAYALSGLMAALGGVFLTTQTTSGSPTIGNDYILNSVAAVVIGGTSLFGGRGGAGGSIIGAFILTLIGDVVFVLGVSSFWTPLAIGSLLIVAVLGSSFIELLEARRGA
jgi:ribose transport system permease protein